MIPGVRPRQDPLLKSSLECVFGHGSWYLKASEGLPAETNRALNFRYGP